MADEEPPRPKPGSLKDRIKQFEKPASSSSNAPAPPPLRPKPGTLGQWKPKPLDPPSPNKQATFTPSTHDASQASDEQAQSSGMSATDAISSISKGGGTLKERMAALQGRGAFGDNSTSAAPPLPSNEGKPRVWRTSPAPPIEHKTAEESTSPTADRAEDITRERSPMRPSPISPHDEHATDAAAGEASEDRGADGSEPQTEEDQERERRAAIAARMARLGGARVGMPGAFGKPPIPTKPRIITPGDTGSAGSSAPVSAISQAPPSSTDEGKPTAARQTTLETALKIPLPKSQGSLSLLTPGSMEDDFLSESDATTSGKLVPPRSPSVPMPIPALPKRTAGPRRKKSARDIKPAPSSHEETESPPVPVIVSTGDNESAAAVPASEPHASTPTQESAKEEGKESEAVMKGEQGDHTDTGLTDEPAAVSVDDLVSAAPSEIATPPPPSPSLAATEDEEVEYPSSVPSRRPTLDVSPAEQLIVEEEGTQILTPRPRSQSKGVADPILSIKIGNADQSESTPTEEKQAEGEPGMESPEDDEAARKRRVAEKMARMGAVNPFSPGGFVSPVSPNVDKPGHAEVKQEDDTADKKSEKDDSVQAAVTKSAAGNNSDVALATDESEPNVPVLSQSHSTRSASNAYAYNEGTGGQLHTASEDEVDLPDLDIDDVDYPMMSPTAGGHFETQAAYGLTGLRSEPVSRGAAAVESTSQDDDQRDSGEDDEQADAETVHEHPTTEDQKTPPQRIFRSIPPPPPQSREEDSSFSTDSGDQFQPTAYEFESQSSRTALAAAIARRAPMPPPSHPQNGSETSTPRFASVSPTPSPPAEPFEREGAPSPPSLGSSSHGDYEEGYDVEDGEYLDYDVSAEQEETQESPSEEVSTEQQEQARTPSPPPVTKASPPPLPPGRPPVPHVRRSIPPPPREPLPATPTADPTARRPPPIPQQSLMVVPDSPGNSASGPNYPTGQVDVEEDEEDDSEAIQALRHATERPALPPPPPRTMTPKQAPRASKETKHEREIMDDDEGDPVDPDFVRNRFSPQGNGVTPTKASEPIAPTTNQRDEDAKDSPEQQPEPEDSEAARRRGIAERMAKLGGIKFGVPVTARPTPARKVAEDEGASTAERNDGGGDANADVDSNLTPEEAERTRRANIAARMAAMGGRGLGMYGAPPAPTAKPPPAPSASPPPIPSSRPKRQSQDNVAQAVARQPPPPPPGNDLSSSIGGETSESEVEMVNAEPDEEGEMVEQVEDEEPELIETPPTLPNRSGRPPVPGISRPPPPPPGSGGPPLPPTRRPASPPNEYEVVDEEHMSPPKSRATHSRPAKVPSAESTANPSLESSGQWELPNIPSGSFDLGNYAKQGRSAPVPAVENDASWTKVEQEVASVPVRGSSSTQRPSEPFSGSPPAPVSAEALVDLAHRLGPTIVSSAQHIHEKSKRLVIGDGSSVSFLFMVLSPINGASTSSLGHLVYAQTGNAVQKRLGDIMPGDIIALYEARFKGHKGGLGLNAYSLSCGTKEEPMLGVISEFEVKKNKIKAFAVNQHPNTYPTIDTPSYKLDDLKGGTLKVFRVSDSS